eukprot:gene38153-51527_t
MSMPTRRATKIVATLGPASSDPALLEAMIRAGVNVVRLNFSHGKAQDHIDRAATVRAAAQRAGREVAIMADLQGPKIRVGKFAEGKVQLESGAKFVLDASRTELGDIDGVGLDYKELPRDVKAGDLLLLERKFDWEKGEAFIVEKENKRLHVREEAAWRANETSAATTRTEIMAKSDERKTTIAALVNKGKIPAEIREYLELLDLI